MEKHDQYPDNSQPVRMSRTALVLSVTVFLACCAGGGVFLSGLLAAKSGASRPLEATAMEADGGPVGEDGQLSWTKALNEIFSVGQVEALPQETDGGVIYSLPSGKMVVREVRPRARRSKKTRAPLPAVEKKYGGEVRRSKGGRVSVKLHGGLSLKGSTVIDTKVPAGEAGAPEPARPRPQVRVTMYSTAWCPACKVARAWLRSRRIAYLEKDPEKDPGAAAELKRINPQGGVPTFVINGHTLVGFSAARIQYLLGVRRSPP